MIEAAFTPMFGFVTARWTSSVARLLIVLPSWRHFRRKGSKKANRKFLRLGLTLFPESGKSDRREAPVIGCDFAHQIVPGLFQGRYIENWLFLRNVRWCSRPLLTRALSCLRASKAQWLLLLKRKQQRLAQRRLIGNSDG